MENIKITLETLYDILRNEKKKEDLQKLESAFFQDVVQYLNEKKSLLGMENVADELLAAGEKEKIEYELRSIKRILKQLYEKREKKIIDIALNKSRTASDIIDISSMLREEKQFYQQILATMDLFRRGVLSNLFKGDLPDVFSEALVKPAPVGKAPLEERKEQIKAELEQKSSALFPEQKQKMTKIKFIHPIPSFVWKDMKVYGPYDPGETISIFPEVAELLVRKGRAEILNA